MPMFYLKRELDFPGLHSATDYTGWRSDFTVAGTANEFHTDFPPCFSVHEFNNLNLRDRQVDYAISSA